MHRETRSAEASALARLMPGARLVQVSGCDVAAGPARAWEHVRDGDLGSPPLVRALFGLRALSDRVRGREPAPLRMRIDDLVSTPENPGFGLLIDDPPREVVVGAIGQVWRPNIPFLHVGDAEAFAAFATRGYVRVAWALRVEPRRAGGARVEVEVRVDATDPDSWRRFRRYFALVGPGSRLVRRALLRRIERDLGPAPLPGDDLLPDAGAQVTHEVTVDAPAERIWPWLAQMGRGRAGFYCGRAAHPPSGRVRVAWEKQVHAVMQRVQLRNLARRAEGRLPATDWRDALAGLGGAGVIAAAAATPFLRGRRGAWTPGAGAEGGPYPGDELIREPRWGWTRAIEIAAPAEEVWRWVAQIGADRGGFYSYTWLENLVGCGVRDAERIHPEWQARAGDRLVLHPSGPPFEIVEAEPGGHLLVFGAPDEEARAAGRPWAAASWLLLTQALGPERTRLVSRYRSAGSGDLRTRLAMGPALMEPIGFAMDRRMLRGIR